MVMICHIMMLVAVLAVGVTSFRPQFSALKPRSYVNSNFLQMGSHGIYDIVSDKEVHSISFEVSLSCLCSQKCPHKYNFTAFVNIH
jgi:hypothetical protein